MQTGGVRLEVCVYQMIRRWAAIIGAPSWISAGAMAAHQIAINCAAFTFMFALGVGMGVSIRVGHTWGAGLPSRIKRIAFGISIATAAIAGALLIIIQPVEPSVGREYIGRVFAICVLGGLGSLPGTLIAAMLLGVVESITATFYGPSWAPAVSFGFLLLTLAFRPSGLLGR